MGIVGLMVSKHKWDNGIASSAHRSDCFLGSGCNGIVLYCSCYGRRLCNTCLRITAHVLIVLQARSC